MSKFAKLFNQPEGLPAAEDNTPPALGFTLLLVDDEEKVLKSLRRVFMDESYTILTALDAEEGLKIMNAEPVHLVISDYMMPGMNGVDFLREVKERCPETIRIMLTGHADVQAVLGAVGDGAVYKFITKPWQDDDLRLSVSLALQQYSLIQENKTLKEINKHQREHIKNLAALSDKDHRVLGNLLAKLKVVSPEDLTRLKGEQQPGEHPIETIARLGLASQAKIVQALQNHLKCEYIDLKETALNAGVAQTLPREFCERNLLLPVRLEGRMLMVAMADPSDIFLKDNIEFLTGLKTVGLIATAVDIRDALQAIYKQSPSSDFRDVNVISDLEPMDEIDIVIEDEDDNLNVQELLESSEVPPIIRVVNAIISEAVRYRASDIHIEPKTKFSLVRYRIDGILHNKIKIPIDYHASTISRIKIIARMDISERRHPQDGRFSVKSGTRLVDIRVSTLPTINGEKATLRVMDKSAAIRRIEDLGVLPEEMQRVYSLIHKHQGIIIATGPTGSGKTTLLYSLLNSMIQSSRNFETIEDPVEYFLEEANQVYVSDRIGLTFASILRSTLRQDPDVILVGEIRDIETADTVFKAGLTGHMVLTTLHTNNAVASITRLLDIGVQPYLISSSLEGIFAQRLVRTVCPKCRTDGPPDPNTLEFLNLPPESFLSVTQGAGCHYCNNTGYAGRTGIFEIFVMNDDLRHLIDTNFREADAVSMAKSYGMHSLLDDGLEKVRQGLTTLDEILRVIGPQTGFTYACLGCGRTIDMKYVFCPFCGHAKEGLCHQCNRALDASWSHCPFCGAEQKTR